jgi:protein SCO1/2
MHFLKITRLLFFILPGLFLVISCDRGKSKLPILGERDWTTRIYNTIPAYRFINQNGDTITEKNTNGKIYVADFFFTSCPTICPVMKRQMVKVYNEFKDNPDFMILSHTVDPDHDTPEVLNQFSKDLGISGTQWQFLTGPKEEIYEIGEKSYMSTAKEDSTAEGGYLHTGAFILVDKEKHVRGMYDGTTEEGTARLIADMKLLLDEYKQ